MGTFTASPDAIRTKGNQIVELAEEFTNNMNKMYATIDKLVNSDYVSPEARVLANRISTYKADLINIRNVMAQYGTFCQGTSNDVETNQDNLSEDVRG